MKWHKGPPPHVGWWLTRYRTSGGRYVHEFWRWWNGWLYSLGVEGEETVDEAAECARWPCFGPEDGIEWSDYYPPNARVPRVDPSKEK